MEMRIYREDSLSTANAQSGQYAFTNAYTRQSSASGTDYQGLQNYASFLLGLPNTTSLLRASDYSEYSKTWGFFVQDDWRVNSKLTLNLGLRYEIETALTERNDKSVSGFDYAYVQPIEGTVQARYAALNDPALKALVPQLSVKGGLMFAGVDGSSRLYETPKNTFLPRFGFAYQLNPKTVIRGGAGLFAGFLGQRRGDVFPNGWSQTTTVGTTTNAFGAPVPRSWDDALLTTPILEPVGNANGRQQGLGQAIDFFNQDPTVSKQLRWQIGFQRELPGGFVVEAAYVGNYGYDIEIVQQHQRPAERVPEHGQLPDRRDERQQHLPDGLGREPVRRAAAGDQLQQLDDRPLAAAAPVPAVRGHPDDEQRRQVVVPLRPGRPAEAVLEGLHAGRLLHLLALDAGDGVPERGRREADQDDLGPGRAAPAVASAASSSSRSARAGASCRTRAGS